MAKSQNSKREGVGRKLVCGIASAALACGLMPAAAFASANVNDDGKVTYTLPTEPMAVQWTDKDASGNSYTYEHLTVSLAAPPMQKPYYSLLGISNTALGRTIAGGGTTETEYGLFGSDANINPDEYLYNYCVTLANPQATVPADIRSGTEATIEATINGTTYNIPRAIYAETNMLTVQSTASSGDYTYAKWVEIENTRPGRSKTTEYNPTFTSFATNPGGTYKMVESMYSIAEAADSHIKASADANGNFRYRTRYAEGANTVDVAADFEDISKGVEYLALAKVADGSIAKLRTAAVVCGYDPATKNYAVRILNPAGVQNDKDSNSYGGRIASAINPMVVDMTTLGLEEQQKAYSNDSRDESTYVKWYSAQQIIENCDAIFTCDAPSWNAVAAYLATASDGTKYAVYSTTELAEDGSQSAEGGHMDDLIAAQAAAQSAGKKAADICYKWPKSLFGVWYAQGCENVMMNFIAAAYLYPEYFNLTDIMAWWAKHLWHITDSSLQDMVDSTCYNISLSTNQSQIGTISANFDEKINAMIDEGNKYYLDNIKTVNAVSDGNVKTHNYYLLADRTKAMTAAEVSTAAKAAGETGETLAAQAVVAGENVFALEETLGIDTNEAYDAAVSGGMTSEEITKAAEAAGVSGSEITAAAIEKSNADIAAAQQAAAAAAAAQKAAEDAQKAAEQAKTAAEEKAAADVAEAKEAQAKAEAAQEEAEKAKAAAEEAKKAAEAAKTAAEGQAAKQVKAAQEAQAKAEAAATAAAKTAASATTITVNKATVKASDITSAATTVILGAKVKKISANTFKGSKVKTIIVTSTKPTKAKVKNSLKGSKVKTVQAPAKKLKAYKKIFTAKIAGKKVKVS